MNLLLVGIALAIPLAQQPNQPPTAQQPNQAASAKQPNQAPNAKQGENMPTHKLDGQWTVTYAEMDGKTLEGKGFTEVTIKDNVVTCRHDGKVKTYRLEFGPHNMVRCTEQIDGKATATTTSTTPNQTGASQHTHHGVYICSPEYLCLGLNKGQDHRSFTNEQGQAGGQASPQQGNQAGNQPAGQAGAANRFGEHGAHGTNFVIILHRGTGAAQTTSTK